MIRLGLESIKNLCEKLGNPQDSLSFIHIAGTNGKGSTGTFIASILRSAGYRVGHFSSPAVFCREEVIKVNGRNISKKDYDDGMALIREKCAELQGEGKSAPTEFECETALAFTYYVNRGCDVVVLECGMGGETDATNIVRNTLACVFTSISLDHTDYLGDTVAKIARVKAGIIKKDAAVVCAPCDNDILNEISSVAKEREAKEIDGKLVDIIQTTKFAKNRLGLKGLNQNENASLAVETVKLIRPCGFTVSEKNISDGLHNAKLSGRFEIISTKPDIILDGGHNEGAAKCIFENLEYYYPGRKVVMVLGMLKNKDHSSYLRVLAPRAEHILTVSTEGDRGYLAEDLAREAIEFTDSVSSIGGVEEAIEIARMMCQKNDVVLIAGTFSILNRAKRIYINGKV